MKFIVGRRPAEKPFHMPSYQQNPLCRHREPLTQKLMLAWGEPFFLNGKYKGKFAIVVFGPGSYWRKLTGELSIVGEAVDFLDHKSMQEILEARRVGDVFARWYSAHCPQGEFGYINCSLLEEITQQHFEEETNGFIKKTANRRRV